MIEPASFSVRKAFSGKGVLLTGSTGFVAKAVAEKILRDLRDIGQIFVLIRPRVKADGSRVDPRDRLREEILRNTAFRTLREQLGDQFESFCDSKISCVPGDLTHERLGLDAETYDALCKKIDIVIHSAATVKFDERLDLALDLNTFGPQRLLELARAAGAIYVHVSTCYVSGRRTGLCPERLVPPLEAIDAQLPPGAPRPEHFDVVEEITRLRELAKTVRADCEKMFNQKNIAPESEDGRAQMQNALVGAGMRRAQSLGWNDTYTYTKYLGEQLLKIKHQEVPTVIVRPSIVESTLHEPEPGWLDTLRMADPIIIGFGKGRLADFPASQNVVLDIIPLDLVVNGILSAAAYISTKPGGFDLFQIASSSENPLVFRSLYEHVRDYFQKHPMTDRAGKPVMVPQWKFPTVDQYRRHMRNRYLRPIRAASMVLDGPFTVPGTRKLRSRLRTLNTTLEQLLYYVDIYGPYVNLQCRFDTAHSRELREALRPDERAAFDFDPRKIRWKNYLQDVHIPGIKRNILRMETVPSVGAGQGHLLDEEGEAARKRGSSSARGVPQTVVDLCARGAIRFGSKPLAEIRRVNPDTQTPAATRLTYAELYNRSGLLARQLIARLGLHPGDRVALIGENCPEWALMYMAISRACCAVVPLDRMMAPVDAARLFKLVDAKAVITSPNIMKTAQDHWGAPHGMPPCLNMLADLEPFAGEAWAHPEASISDRPLKDPSPETLASIIFTSGTTRDPKGVMLSHSNVIADALAVAEVLEPMETDRFLSVLPLNHAFEFTCDFLIPMYGGSTIHYVENLKDVADTMKLAEITVVLGVPRLFKLFMDKIKTGLAVAGAGGKIGVRIGKTMASAWEMAGAANPRKRIFKKIHDAFGGRLRLFVSGGAALSPEIFNFFKNFGINIVEGYGLTETSPVLAVNPLAAPKAGSVGPAVPGVELRINQPDGAGIGEVFARGPSIMQGYWHNPSATEKTFEGGWFKTGDLGRIDKDGYLHITGRLKDVIVTAAGKNVYPDEVESALSDIPGAREICVLGMPARSGMGEEVAVVVVPENDNARKSIKAAIDRVNSGLASHQRIARVEFQNEDLPKTSTLKVQRSKLRDRHCKGGADAGARPGSESAANLTGSISAEGETSGSLFVDIARVVAEVAEGRVTASEVTPEMKLQIDLGIDSIGRVDLLHKLELRLGIVIPSETEGKLFTVRDVISVAETARKSGALAAGGKAAKDMWKQTGRGVEDVQAGMKPSLSKSLLQGVFGASASVFMNTYLRVDCFGLEHIPQSGPYILTANHCSHLDSVAIREVLGKRAAGLHVMGAKDYFFDTRLKSWFFTTFLNALPLDREENAAESLAACRAVLEGNRAILIFPEGTRSVSGELQPFKPGIGVLGLELEAPVIPIHLRGTYASLPKGRSLPKPTRIEVRIGPAVDFSALKAQRGLGQQTELYRRAAAELRARIEALANLPSGPV
jgi:long-chain acyl-CoA synthetase